MPVRAAAAHHAVSGNGRLVALRWLLTHPNSTRAEIVAGTGITSSAAQSILLTLEDLGYIRIDNPDEPRKGRMIRYTAERAQITRDLHEFVAWTIS